MLSSTVQKLMLFPVICSALAGQSIGSTGSNQKGTRDIAANFRAVLEMWEHKDLGHLSDLVDAAYKGHTSSGDRDRDGLKARIEKFHSLYSDIHFRVLDQLVSGDRVAIRLEASCTESSSGKILHMIGMNISIYRNGKQIEEWATWEVLPAKNP